VREGGTTEIVLRKPVLTTVKGSVRDRSGPVKGAQVVLTKEGDFRSPLGGGLEDYTDEDGHFEITGVPSGKYTLSWGRRSAVVPSEDEIRLEKSQAELVRQLLIPGAMVKLKAWDAEEDEAATDAEVTLSRIRAPTPGQGQQPRRQTQVRMIAISNRGGVGPQRVDMSAGDPAARTDEDGAVVIKDVPPGKYELSIKHRRLATHQEEIEILADAILDLGTKKLTSGGSVSGRIVFEDTDSMQMALVQLTTSDGKNTERTVSTGGRFRFSGLATGKYKVRAQRVGKANEPWGPEETVEVKPGSTARTQLRLR
jgi:Carboxypeptidase regulatory-like domain